MISFPIGPTLQYINIYAAILAHDCVEYTERRANIKMPKWKAPFLSIARNTQYQGKALSSTIPELNAKLNNRNRSQLTFTWLALGGDKDLLARNKWLLQLRMCKPCKGLAPDICRWRKPALFKVCETLMS